MVSRHFDIVSTKRVDLASARRGRRFGKGRTLELVDEIEPREVILAGRLRGWGCPTRCGAAARHSRRSRSSSASTCPFTPWVSN